MQTATAAGAIEWQIGVGPEGAITGVAAHFDRYRGRPLRPRIEFSSVGVCAQLAEDSGVNAEHVRNSLKPRRILGFDFGRPGAGACFAGHGTYRPCLEENKYYLPTEPRDLGSDRKKPSHIDTYARVALRPVMG